MNALEGIRIVDFGWVFAGPLATRLLADMGAEVIKVESRHKIDEARQSPQNLAKDIEKDPVHHDRNRNKLSITVDFTNPKGVELLKKLISKSDVVVENYAPRVLPKYGLDYKSLRSVNPKIIMLSMPAAGDYGPLRDIVTYGPSLSSLAGFDSMVGYPGEKVLGSQGFYPDLNSAVHGAFAVLAALYHREETGEGQYINMSQLEAFVSCMGESIMDYTMNGRSAGTLGNIAPNLVPNNNYRCLGDDKWVSIAVKDESEWTALCEAMGQPELACDPIFADKYLRQKNRTALDTVITAWTSKQSMYQVTTTLQQVGVAAAPCLSIVDRCTDPHLAERQVHVDVNHPATGTDVISGVLWRLSDTPGSIYRHAPLLGEHNEYIFGKLLGMSKQEMDALKEEKVIY